MYIYFLQCSGNYKIGVAENVEKRIRVLQVGNPHEITLSFSYHFPEKHHAFRMEKIFHEAFKKLSRRGEWFSLDDNCIVLSKGILESMSNNDKETMMIYTNDLADYLGIDHLLPVAGGKANG